MPTLKDLSKLQSLRCISPVCLCVVILLMFSSLRDSRSVLTETAAAEELVRITPGTSVYGEVSGGAKEDFGVPADAGSLLRFSIEKGDLGLTTAIYGPANSKILEHVSEEFELVELSIPVDVSGTYRIEIQSREKAATPRPFELKVEPLIPDLPGRRQESEAQQAMATAGVLRAKWEEAAQIHAGEQCDKAVAVWTSSGNFRSAAQASLKSGDAYFLLTEYPEALKRYQNAAKLASKAGDNLAEARALSRLSRVYSYTGKNDLAQGELTKALNLLKPVDTSPLAKNTHAEVLATLGEVVYSKGDLSKASDQFKLAAELFQGDRKGEAKAHLFAGYIAGSIGMPEKARAEGSQALELYQTTNDKSGEGFALTLLGLFYSFKGQQDRAIELHGKAIEIFQFVGDRYGEAIATTALGQAHIYFNDHATALTYFQKALQIIHSRGLLDLEPVAAFKVAQLYLQMNLYDQALSAYQRSMQLSRAAGKVRTEINALTDIAKVYAKQKHIREAQQQCSRVLRFYESIDDRRGQGVALNALGEVFLETGKNVEAAALFRRARPLAEKAADKGIVITTFYNLARAEHNLGHFEEALSLIEQSLKTIEELRQQVGSPELRASYFSGARKNYELGIQILIDLDRAQPGKGYAAQAFLMYEKSQARSLLDLIKESGADLRQGAPQELLNRQLELRGFIQRQAQYQLDLKISGREAPEIAEVENKILELKSQYQQIEAQLREQNSRALSLAQFEPLSLEQVQSELREDDLLLEFSLGDKRSLLWAVTRDSFQYYELPGRKTIGDSAVAFYESLTKQQRGEGVGSDKSDLKTAASLSEMLFGQVATQLGSHRLVLVTEGALHLVPFDALPVPFAPAAPDTRPRYLLEDHEIVYLPSIATLRAIRAIGKTELDSRSKVAAVIADPVFSASDDRVRSPSLSPAVTSAAVDQNSQEFVESSFEVLRSGGPARLTHSSEEADAIAEAAPPGTTMVVKGFDATRERAMNSRLDEYQILHFATHAFLNDQHPELSSIVLTMVDKDGVETNGVMPLHDIYSLNLSAELTVLSACETALGREIRGEGMVGLAHSFISAGSKSVIASLWKVDDRATAALMEEMYRPMLQQGMSPAAALRVAKLKVLQDKRWSAPYFWAGFIVQGEYTNHIAVENHSSGKFWVILLCSLLLTVAGGVIVFKVRQMRGSFSGKRP